MLLGKMNGPSEEWMEGIMVCDSLSESGVDF